MPLLPKEVLNYADALASSSLPEKAVNIEEKYFTESLAFCKVRGGVLRPMPLLSDCAFRLRYLLGRELYRMKRPEISDLLGSAGFEAQGRELVIAIPGPHTEYLASVISAALLNCGLPFDTAILC